MTKTSNPTEIGALRTNSSTSIGSLLDRWFAARFVELRTALAVEAAHQDLIRRSAAVDTYEPDARRPSRSLSAALPRLIQSPLG